eukprot:269718_1
MAWLSKVNKATKRAVAKARCFSWWNASRVLNAAKAAVQQHKLPWLPPGWPAADHGPLDKPKTVDDVRATPYPLLPQFHWCEIDMTDDNEVTEVYELLKNHYVEDTESMFRFDYSRDFLKWALMPPGYLKQWHAAIRTKKNKLVAFISAIPANVQVYENQVKMVELNFLCIHKKLRGKRLAPVLIKEITRRANRENIWQAAYTAGVVLPKPVAKNKYYHRSLNPKKLIEVGFSRLANRMTMKRTIRFYALPTETKATRIRQMEAYDVPAVHKLLSDYLSKFSLHANFSEEEVKHWFVPRKDVISSFVIEDPTTKAVTDFLCFYSLPSSILNHPKHDSLRACYSYYNVATTVPLDELMKDALILAKQENFDVFNALDVMDNKSFTEKLKFGVGDGNLQYYLSNWRCPEIKPEENGLVLM